MKSLKWSIANRAGIVGSVLAIGWMATDLYAKQLSVTFVWSTVLWGVLWIIEAIRGRNIEKGEASGTLSTSVTCSVIYRHEKDTGKREKIPREEGRPLPLVARETEEVTAVR